MAVMVIIFFILFSVSVAALSITSSQRKALLKKSWRSLSEQSKGEVQNWGKCCGFEDMNITKGPEGHPSCAEVLILLNFGLHVLVRVVVKCTCNLFTHEAPKSFRNCAIPALTTAPSLLSPLCHPCSHHCTIPALTTVPFLLSPLCHPCSQQDPLEQYLPNHKIDGLCLHLPFLHLKMVSL